MTTFHYSVGQIYYISDQQNYYAPPFPFSNPKWEFNVISWCDLVERHPDEKIQKVVVLNSTIFKSDTLLSRCRRTGYTRVRDCSPCCAFPYSDPISIRDYKKSDEYNYIRNQYVIFDAVINPDLCKVACEHGLSLKEVKNPTHEIVMYFIKFHPKNITYIPDHLVNDEIRNYIKSLTESQLKAVKMKPIFKSSLVINPLQEHPEANQLVQSILSGESTGVNNEQFHLFEDLDVLKNDFIDWLNDYHKLKRSSKLDLESIGYADENHRRNRRFKKHLMERTQHRFNITKICCINNKDTQGISEFLTKYPHVCKFIIEMGFKIVIHNRRFWRRGTDVDIYKVYLSDGEIFIRDKGWRGEIWAANELTTDDRAELFIINKTIEESDFDCESSATDTDEDSD